MSLFAQPSFQALNISNGRALAELTACGMQRWVLPVECSAALIRQARAQYLELVVVAPLPQIGVFAYGHLPLAYSSRCFVA
jgi:collagenase-like PrtC family protease